MIVGLGVGLFYSAVTTAAVTALPDSQSSLAGGLVYMFQIAGGAIGLGLTTAVFSNQPTFIEGIEAAFRLDAVLAEMADAQDGADPNRTRLEGNAS